ncbi:MAG: TIGR03936 family radical SAM-associated protein [Planctomycetaceae bacterium]|jgi:radical SAM-linked protein|nr:TIGR03936 family radical SAM-associated protein [Planctomycetaceae bacterium]
MGRQRVRIRFCKSGRLRYIGHQDLVVVLERLFRRAAVPLAMSQGFHPKPKISSPSALALGIAGEDEVVDIEIREDAVVETSKLLDLLNRHSVDGLVFLQAETLDTESKKARLYSSLFVMVVPEDVRSKLSDGIRDLLAKETVMIEKPNGKTVDVRAGIVSLELSEPDGILSVELLANKSAQSGPEVGIKELLTAVGLENSLFRTVFPIRKKVRLV